MSFDEEMLEKPEIKRFRDLIKKVVHTERPSGHQAKSEKG